MQKLLLTISLGLTCLASRAQQDINWLRVASGPQLNFDRKVSTDSDGNIYTIGSFYGTADLDPGTAVYNVTSTSSFGSDAYITKTTKNGVFVWGFYFECGVFWNQFTIDVDADGNVLTTGHFDGTTDFDPGSGTASLTGTDDIFVLKTDTDGNFGWVHRITGLGDIRIYNTAHDIYGKFILAGSTTETTTFEFLNITDIYTPVGVADGILVQLDNDGNYFWCQAVSSIWQEEIMDVECDQDAAGAIYISGYTTSQADFDLTSLGINIVNPIGVQDGFVMKLDNGGNNLWYDKIGGDFSGVDTYIQCSHLERNDAGVMYVAGTFSGTANFDAAPMMPSAGGDDVFLIQYSNTNIPEWAVQLSSENNDLLNALAMDEDGNAYLTGLINDTLDIDPGTAVFEVLPTGTASSYFSKIDATGAYVWGGAFTNLNPMGHGRYTDLAITPENAILFSGTSISIVDAHPNSAQEYIVYINGGFDLLINQCGTTANSGVQVTDTTLVCLANAATFEWFDSNGDLLSGETDATLSVSPPGGSFYAAVTQNGCTVNTATLSLCGVVINESVSVVGNTLVCAETDPAALFLWYRCADYSEVPGETSSSFTPDSSGYYYVSVELSGCVQESSCTYVNHLAGISEINLQHLTVFPNPSAQTLNFNLPSTDANRRIEILTLDGRLVQAENSNQNSISVADLVSGMYVLRIVENNKLHIASFVKK
jgi:Secretion system C-terminal sorting domain